MTSAINPDDPEVASSLREAASCIEEMQSELLAAHPAIAKSLAIPGMLVGAGLGFFVASGMTDSQIVAQVLAIVDDVRRAISTPAASA